MFPEEIRLERQEDIPYGTTRVSSEQSQTEIMKLLERFGAKRYWWMNEPDGQKIVFELEGKPYIIRIPKVHIKQGRGHYRKYVYDPRVGIRIVLVYLKTFLPFVQCKALAADKLLLGARMIYDENNGMVPLADRVETVIDKGGYHAILPAMSTARKE